MPSVCANQRAAERATSLAVLMRPCLPDMSPSIESARSERLDSAPPGRGRRRWGRRRRRRSRLSGQRCGPSAYAQRGSRWPSADAHECDELSALVKRRQHSKEAGDEREHATGSCRVSGWRARSSARSRVAGGRERRVDRQAADRALDLGTLARQIRELHQPVDAVARHFGVGDEGAVAGGRRVA